DNMRVSGNVMGQPQYVIVLAGEHMRTVAASGWGKKEIRDFVWKHTQNSLAHLKRTQRMSGAIQDGDETKLRPLVESPDDLLVVPPAVAPARFPVTSPAGVAGARRKP